MLGSKWIAAAVACIVLLITHVVAYYAGGSGCEARHADKQLRIIQEQKRSDEKIDADTPYHADKHDAIQWLLQHTRRK